MIHFGDLGSSAMQTAMATGHHARRYVTWSSTYATEQLTVPKMIEIREAVGKELGEGTVSLEQIRISVLDENSRVMLAVPGRKIWARQLYDLYMDSRLGNSRLFADVHGELDGSELGTTKLDCISYRHGNTYPERDWIARMVFGDGRRAGSRMWIFPNRTPVSFNTRLSLIAVF